MNKEQKKKEQDILEFFQKNPDYEVIGIDNVARQFGVDRNTITSKAKKFGFFKPRKNGERLQRGDVNAKVDISQFLPVVRTPEAAYFLGQMWTDGHVARTRTRAFSLRQARDDFEAVQWVYEKIGAFKFIDSAPSDGMIDGRVVKARKWMRRFSSTHKGLYDFLCSLGFLEKSGGSMEKLINSVPEHLKKFLIRGLIDGDGCIMHGIGKKRTYTAVSLSSTINQDWEAFVEYLASVGVDAYIKRERKGCGGTSAIVIHAPIQIEKFLDFVYAGYEVDGIGFSRKYRKYIEIKTYRSTLVYIGGIKISNSGVTSITYTNGKVEEFPSVEDASNSTGYGKQYLKDISMGRFHKGVRTPGIKS